MAHEVNGSLGLAQKAGTRRARIAIFGGSLNKKVGRRGRGGAQFNRKGLTPFAQAQQRLRDALRPKPVSFVDSDTGGFGNDDDDGDDDGDDGGF